MSSTARKPWNLRRTAPILSILVALLFLPGSVVAQPVVSSAAVPAGLTAVAGPAGLSASTAAAVSNAHFPSYVTPQAAAEYLAIEKDYPSVHLPSLTPIHITNSAYQALDTPALERAAGSGPALTATHPAVNTADNWYVTSSECSNAYSTTQVGGNPNDLVQAMSSNFGIYNGSLTYETSNGWTYQPAYTASTPCSVDLGPQDYYSVSNETLTHGLAEVGRSTDGGKTWTTTDLPQNTSWSIGSPSYANGDLFNDTLNESMATGFGDIASNSNGNLLLYADTYQGFCNIIWMQFVMFNDGSSGFPCNIFNINNTKNGVAVSVSTDGGKSWSAQHVVGSPQQYFYFCTEASEILPGNEVESPTIAIDSSTGHATLLYDEVNFTWAENATSSSCDLTGLGLVTYHSQSTNGGVTWSTPSTIFIGKSGGGGVLPQVAVGPAPDYNLTAVALDYGNFTGAGGTVDLQVAHSVNAGSTWSSPRTVATVNQVPDHAPGSTLTMLSPQIIFYEYFYGESPPAIAVDNWSTSPHEYNTYIAWTDNESGSNAGYPGIEIETSTDNATSFGSAVSIYDSSHDYTYWDPSLSVDPDGTVWVSFMSISSSTGYVQEMGSFSRNGGASFVTPFPIADAVSDVPTVPPGPFMLGPDYGLVSTTNGTIAAWTDARLSNLTTTFDTEVLVSRLNVGSVATSGATATINVTTYGDSRDISIAPSSPIYTAWAVGSTQTLTAPLSVPINATDVGSFEGWSGVATSSTSVVSFQPSGSGGTETASYEAVAAATIAGTIAPNLTTDRVTVDGVAVALSPDPSNPNALMFSVAVTGTGEHTVVGSSGIYWTTYTNSSVPATQGQVTTVTIVLQKTTGTLTGKVSVPDGASLAATSVLLNGTTSVPFNVTTGLIDYALDWGDYYLTASNPVTTSFSSSSELQVSPGQSTSVSPSTSGVIQLNGGWIFGNVYDTGSVFKGLAINANGTGPSVSFPTVDTYNVSRVAGWYWVNASVPGYSNESNYVQVIPGQGTAQDIHLTNTALIVGSIGPSTVVANAHTDGLALIVENVSDQLNYQPTSINPSTGFFNVTVRADINYEMTVSASGYVSQTVTVKALAAGTQSAAITITLALKQVANCSTNNSCPPVTKNTTSSSSFPLTLVLAIVVVIALVAIVGAVLLMRRRSGGSGGGDDSGAMADSGDAGTAGTEAQPDWSEPQGPQ